MSPDPNADAFYHACEQSNTALLDLLYAPGFESMVNHKLDFEDAAGLQWFLDRGVDVNANRCLHHAICRGRGLTIITMLLDAGADVNLPWDRWDVGRRPLALAARCGHLAAYELLAERGAEAELDPVDAAVLAVARGESVQLPRARAPSLGNPGGDDYGWILGQFALLGRTDVVSALLDTGMAVDTRGWSNLTPLDQAAMHGRTETVRLLIERGADLHDCAFDAEGPTPLDSALWGVQNNRADDGDYAGTVEALLAAGAPTRHSGPTGDEAVDALLAKHAAPARAASYVLLPGAGGDSWYWHLVAPRLRALGHEVLTPDLPADDDAAGLTEYADTVVDEIGDRAGVIVVAQSMAAFSAPLLCDRVDVGLLVLVAPMIPAPGESPGAWWSDSGQTAARRQQDEDEGRDPDAEFDLVTTLMHDVPSQIVDDAVARGEPRQSDTPFAQPWPLDTWPGVPTRVLAGRHDRLFPLEFMRGLSAERLGVAADVIDTGHLPALSRPEELTRWLEAYRLQEATTAK